jgi:hypothetical protein
MLKTNENTKPVKSFISSLCNKNYKDANTALQKMIETKLRERVVQAEKEKNN